MSAENAHGRAQADGTVFLRTNEGELKVGQFVGQDAQSALAFFVKKYDDLVADIEVAMSRAKAGKAPVDALNAVVSKVQEALANPKFVGDVQALQERLDQLIQAAAARKEQIAAEKAAAKAAALETRKAIVAKAEELANSTAWKSTGETFKTLLDDWKKLPNFERAAEQELWKRFSHARSQFDKARRLHFANLDTMRAEAIAGKEALAAKAAELANSQDWGATTAAFRDLMDKWKTLPRAGRGDEDRLWATFKSAQDKFFEARTAANSMRESEFAENLKAKLALVEEAEKLLPITDVEAAKRALRSISERWAAIGHVARTDRDRIEKRLAAVEAAARKVEQDLWTRTKPEVIERANSLRAMFAAAVDRIDDAIAKARAAGDTAEVEKLEKDRAAAAANLEAATNGPA